MISRALYHVALGLMASTLALQGHAEPVVLNAGQMDGVTASAAAPADGGEAADRWYPMKSAFNNEGALLGPTSSETAGEKFSLPAGPAVSAAGTGPGSYAVSDGGSVSSGRISRSVTSNGLGATTISSSASAFAPGPSSVFVSSATTFAPDGMAMSAFSSSLARSSSLAGR